MHSDEENKLIATGSPLKAVELNDGGRIACTYEPHTRKTQLDIADWIDQQTVKRRTQQ